MKRAGHLIEKIADIDNLRLAFWKARRGKEGKPEIQAYRVGIEERLLRLSAQIRNGTVEIGRYNYFKIFDPKARQICAAAFEERVLQHAIMNICHPFFEQKQIDQSYACRKNKGTYKALEQAQIYHKQYAWFLKLDYKKFFDSINHAVLKEQLRKMFKDEYLLRLFDQIIDSYEVEEGKGVPIGNLTSQYFSNHYLSEIDHFIKEKMQVKAYVRYMDDMVLWSNNKEELLEQYRLLEQKSAQELRMTFKPMCLNKQIEGLPFLGYLIYEDKTHLSHRSRYRFIKKMRYNMINMEENRITEAAFQQKTLPLIAFTLHADSRRFRQKVMQEYGQ
jgi:RNA-directed DNA polymerase